MSHYLKELFKSININHFDYLKIYQYTPDLEQVIYIDKLNLLLKNIYSYIIKSNTHQISIELNNYKNDIEQYMVDKFKNIKDKHIRDLIDMYNFDTLIKINNDNNINKYKTIIQIYCFILELEFILDNLNWNFNC